MTFNYRIYDHKSSLTLPTGKTMTYEELKASGRYKTLCEEICVIGVDDNGIFRSYTRLSDLKSVYGITTEDPEQAMNECLAAQEEAVQQSKQEQANLEQVADQANMNTQAIAELGVMTAEGQTTNADLLQAVGELGVQVAELSVKIEQLQTPTA